MHQYATSIENKWSWQTIKIIKCFILPSLKMGWKTTFLLGYLPGRCYVSFRECKSPWLSIEVWALYVCSLGAKGPRGQIPRWEGRVADTKSDDSLGEGPCNHPRHQSRSFTVLRYLYTIWETPGEQPHGCCYGMLQLVQGFMGIGCPQRIAILHDAIVAV